METALNTPIIYCADGIVHYGHRFVVVERLKEAGKLALPGGKQDVIDGLLEPLSKTVLRELREETGLVGTIKETWRMCAEIGRDPRGHFVSCIFIIHARGTIFAGEAEKVRPVVLSASEIIARHHDFAFDHGDIFREYLSH